MKFVVIGVNGQLGIKKLKVFVKNHNLAITYQLNCAEKEIVTPVNQVPQVVHAD
jgi:hypothetical protein